MKSIRQANKLIESEVREPYGTMKGTKGKYESSKFEICTIIRSSAPWVVENIKIKKKKIQIKMRIIVRVSV